MLVLYIVCDCSSWRAICLWNITQFMKRISELSFLCRDERPALPGTVQPACVCQCRCSQRWGRPWRWGWGRRWGRGHGPCGEGDHKITLLEFEHSCCFAHWLNLMFQQSRQLYRWPSEPSWRNPSLSGIFGGLLVSQSNILTEILTKEVHEEKVIVVASSTNWGWGHHRSEVFAKMGWDNCRIIIPGPLLEKKGPFFSFLGHYLLFRVPIFGVLGKFIWRMSFQSACIVYGIHLGLIWKGSLFSVLLPKFIQIMSMFA